MTTQAGIPASTVNGGEGLGASPGKPLLGGVLEWGEDEAAGFAGRLQATPAVLGHDVSFPIKGAEQGYLREFPSQSAAAGAHALITVNPTVPLAEVNAGGAADFAAQLEELAAGFPGKLLIRFAPDMNSSWVPWGQQPEAYVPAYRAMAEAFDENQRADGVAAVPGAGLPVHQEPQCPGFRHARFRRAGYEFRRRLERLGRALRPVLPGRRRR